MTDTLLEKPAFVTALERDIRDYMDRSGGREPSVVMITRAHWDSIRGDLDRWVRAQRLDDGANRFSIIGRGGAPVGPLALYGVQIIVLEDKGWALL